MTTIPDSALPDCVICGQTVPFGAEVLWEITGYRRDREQGGANHIIARQDTGRVVGPCCAELVQKRRLGQQSLL